MNEKKDSLYLECYSGISGDMVTAALLDLGADEVVLRKALASLPLDGFSINISRVKKAGLDACDFDVVLDAEHENHDHDTAYLYGGVEECGHTHDVHEHNHDEHDHHHDEDGHEPRHGHCCHDHAAEHCHDHEHDHAHRGLAEVLDILNKADLTDRARATAVRIFTILGQAEAKAHGATLETVHFHEVGAVDSIVDITAAAVCLDNLGIEDVIVPVLYEGTGSIRCAHGVLPIPVPAVVNIAAAEHLNLHITGAKGEYVTPTGEALGYVMERLLAAGARDVQYSPVYMKKNRPAYLLTVLCLEEDIPALEEIIFAETTTIGIRRVRMERSILKRHIYTIPTSLGDVEVKMCLVPHCNGNEVFEDVEERCYPEYESIKAICKRTGRSYQDVTRQVLRELAENKED